MNLTELAQSMEGCRRCVLGETRTNIVFGRGSENATVLFFGEGPGADEDKQGKPFVGRAGQLLDKIIEAAELPSDDIYICNVVKCRPPSNRLPAPPEIAACSGFWQKQFELIHPSIIVCLGAVATQTLIDPRAKITQVRGIWVEKDGCRIMPTFHPAALLRDESKKRPVWEDMKKVRDLYFALQKGRDIWPPVE